MKDAHKSIICEGSSNENENPIALIPGQRIMLEDFIDIFEVIDDRTQLIGMQKTPKIPDVEICTASIIERLDYHIRKSSSMISMAKVLRSDILSRGRHLYNKFPIIELVAQVLLFYPSVQEQRILDIYLY